MKIKSWNLESLNETFTEKEVNLLSYISMRTLSDQTSCKLTDSEPKLISLSAKISRPDHLANIFSESSHLWRCACFSGSQMENVAISWSILESTTSGLISLCLQIKKAKLLHILIESDILQRNFSNVSVFFSDPHIIQY